MIVLSNINKYYNKGKTNESHIINDISLSLPDKGLITLLGSSGAGKTTLLNVIGGLDKASGTIQIDDFKINKYNMNAFDTFRKSHIGYIFQNYNLLYSQTVYDNLRIALEIVGVTDFEEVDKRITYCLKAVGMYNFRKKYVNSLSGGQQQRVSIARALVKKSSIIIADEPTGNLDSKNSEEVMRILKSLSKKVLIILVTHNNRLAYSYSDQIYGIEDGKIISRKSLDINEYENENNDIINLAEMNHNTIKLNNISFDIYFDDNTKSNNIKIIATRNQIYYECEDNGTTLKNINQADFIVKDDSQTEIEYESIDFDDSFYQDKKERASIHQLFSKFKSMIKEILFESRIKKIFLVSLTIIGMILAFSMIMLTVSMTKNYNGRSYNSSYATVITNKEAISNKSIVKEALANDYIDNILCPIDTTVSYYRNINFERSIAMSLEYKALPYQEGHVKLSTGNYPKDGEVVISQGFVDKIISTYKINVSEEELIGTSVVVDLLRKQYSLKISGLSKDDQMLIYVTDTLYDSACFELDLSKYTFCKNAKNEILENGDKVYNIVRGRDVLDYDTAKRKELLVNDQEYNNLPAYIDINRQRYYVVGTYSYPIELERNTYITNSYQTLSIVSDIGFTDPSTYLITSGRAVQNDNEILVRSDSTMNIGDTYMGYEVVGKFTGSGQAIKYSYISTHNTAICESFEELYLFDVFASNSLTNLLNDNGSESMDWYESLYYNDNSRMIYTIVSGVLLITSGILIYFVVRSMIIDQKNEIVVYRSLGKSRKGLLGQSMIKLLILTTVTCLLGYLSMVMIYQIVSLTMSNTFEVIISLVTIKYIMIGIGLMYLMIIMFGALPYIRLLRKTPIDILKEYDM